jgi:hypothetical protein
MGVRHSFVASLRINADGGARKEKPSNGAARQEGDFTPLARTAFRAGDAASHEALDRDSITLPAIARLVEIKREVELRESQHSIAPAAARKSILLLGVEKPNGLRSCGEILRYFEKQVVSAIVFRDNLT